MRNMIRFDNLSKRYPGGFEALKNVSFEMGAGEMAFLTGHSGAGKSTLIKLLLKVTYSLRLIFKVINFDLHQ